MKVIALASAFFATVSAWGQSYIPDTNVLVEFSVEVEHVRSALASRRIYSEEYRKSINYKRELQSVSVNIEAAVTAPSGQETSGALGIEHVKETETQATSESLSIAEDEVHYQEGSNQIERIVTIITKINGETMTEIKKMYVDIDTPDMRQMSIDHLNDVYVTNGPDKNVPRAKFYYYLLGCRSPKHILFRDKCYTTVKFDAAAHNLGNKYDGGFYPSPESYFTIDSSRRIFTDPKAIGKRPPGDKDPHVYDKEIDLDWDHVQNTLTCRWWDDDDRGQHDLMCDKNIYLRDIIASIQDTGYYSVNPEEWKCRKGGTAEIKFYVTIAY